MHKILYCNILVVGLRHGTIRDMQSTKITKGTKIEANKLIMVVTGETETSFLGYYEYKGNPVAQCSMLKSMIDHPHYSQNIKILN